MKLNEKQIAVIKSDIDTLDALTSFDEASWEDEDIEAIAQKHSLTIDETVGIMYAMYEIKDRMNRDAVKAADEAAKSISFLPMIDERKAQVIYVDVWHGAYVATMKAIKAHMIDIITEL